MLMSESPNPALFMLARLATDDAARLLKEFLAIRGGTAVAMAYANVMVAAMAHRRGEDVNWAKVLFAAQVSCENIFDEDPPFAAKSTDLAAALRDFELTYAAYSEFQRMMERYWCIRWLRQNHTAEVVARVLRDNVVRLEEAPFVFKVASMPMQVPGSRVRLAVGEGDLLDIELAARYLATLSEPSEEEREAEMQT